MLLCSPRGRALSKILGSIRPRYEPSSMLRLSPSYIRAIAPYQPGSRSPSGPRDGVGGKRIVKLASNENLLGVSPLARRRIEAQLQELALLPGRQRLRVEASAGRPLPGGPDHIVQRLQRRPARGGRFLGNGTSAAVSDTRSSSIIWRRRLREQRGWRPLPGLWP